MGWPKSAEGNVGVCVWGGAEQVTSRMRTLGHGPVWSNRASGFYKKCFGMETRTQTWEKHKKKFYVGWRGENGRDAITWQQESARADLRQT